MGQQVYYQCSDQSYAGNMLWLGNESTKEIPSRSCNLFNKSVERQFSILPFEGACRLEFLTRVSVQEAAPLL
jgi:hypothetical protein